MVHITCSDSQGAFLHLPWQAVRFPLEWQAPEGFHADDLSTWPRVEGRLEYVSGRLRYMPPCGGIQQEVATDVTRLLADWADSHLEFAVGSNEAGMLLGGEVRGADAAVWRRGEAGTASGLRRVPPVLAVEVAGQDEEENALREKAGWYLAAGVCAVWLVLPETREVIVVTAGRESRHPRGERLPARPELPGLEPEVAAFFRQLDRKS